MQKCLSRDQIIEDEAELAVLLDGFRARVGAARAKVTTDSLFGSTITIVLLSEERG